MRQRELKAEKLQEEVDRIEAKRGGAGGLSEGQQQQIARNLERLEQLQEAIEEKEEELRESLEATLLDRAGESGAAVAGKRVRGASSRGEEGDSDDEFFDRTKRARSAAAAGSNILSSADVTRGAAEFQLTGALRRKCALQERVACLEAEVREWQGSAAPEEDGLDAVLRQERFADLKKSLKRARADLEAGCAAVAHFEGALMEADPTGLALADFKAREAAQAEVPSETKVSGASGARKAAASEEGVTTELPCRNEPPSSDGGAASLTASAAMPPPPVPRREKPLGPCLPEREAGAAATADGASVLPPSPSPPAGLEIRAKKASGAVEPRSTGKEALLATARAKFEETMLLRERASVAGVGGVETPPDIDDGSEWVPPPGHKAYRL